MSSSSLERFWGHTFYQNVRSIKLTTEWHLWFYYITCYMLLHIHNSNYNLHMLLRLLFHFHPLLSFFKNQTWERDVSSNILCFLDFQFWGYLQADPWIRTCSQILTDLQFWTSAEFFFPSSSLSWELWLFARVSLSLKAFFCLVHQFIALMWN